MSRVLVLNASYEPLNVTTVRRAVVLLLKERAELIKRNDQVLRSEALVFDHPEVIRLVTYVRIPQPIHRRLTRRAVLARDGWRCAYCGSETTLTIDHVVPRSRGGLTEWSNIVAACAPCNKLKGNLSPKEAGLRLRREPKPPRSDVFVLIATRTPPVTWEPYLTR